MIPIGFLGGIKDQRVFAEWKAHQYNESYFVTSQSPLRSSRVTDSNSSSQCPSRIARRNSLAACSEVRSRKGFNLIEIGTLVSGSTSGDFASTGGWPLSHI